MPTKRRIFSAGVLAVAISLSPLAAKAQSGQITGISVQPSPAMVGRQVTITVQGTGICYGGSFNTGEPEDPKKQYGGPLAIGPRRPSWEITQAALPVSFTWFYDKSGTYHITAAGYPHMCTGQASFDLVVRASPDNKFVGSVLGAAGSRAASAPVSRMGGSDTCKQGFVWREAVKSDHVCVSPETRARTRAENGTGGVRTVPGSDTCKQGYVWREAVPTDHVCVTPQSRAAAAEDNRRAAERRVN